MGECRCIDEADEEAVLVGVRFQGAWSAFRTSGEAGFRYGSFSGRGLSGRSGRVGSMKKRQSYVRVDEAENESSA